MRRILLHLGSWMFLVAIFIIMVSGLEIVTNTQTGFDEGTYVNTTFNATLNGVQLNLSHENVTTGTYTSRIFDAGRNATWSSFAWTSQLTEREYLFVVDGSGAVYASYNAGTNWTQRTLDYGHGSNTRDMMTDERYVYIVFSNQGREVWRSADLGRTWIIVNDSFSTPTIHVGEADSKNNLYVINGQGDVYLSNTSGTTWTLQGDFNGGGSTNPRALAVNGSDALFVVDGNDAVYMSTNQGVNWTQRISDYGGGGADDMEASNSSLYILFNKQIWRSNTSGASWSIINDSFSTYGQDGLRMYIDSQNRFFVLDEAGRVFRSLNGGFAWKELSDFNGGNANNALGFSGMIVRTNLTAQVRSCSLALCSDAVLSGPDGTAGSAYSTSSSSLTLTGRYFQYRFNFTTPEGHITPVLHNVTVTYALLQLSTTVNLTLNGTSGNITTTQGQNITLVGELGGANGTLNLTIDSIVEATGLSPLTYVRNFTDNGTFAVGMYYFGDENFTASNATWYVIVQERASGSSGGGSNTTNQTGNGAGGGGPSGGGGDSVGDSGYASSEGKFRSGQAPETGQSVGPSPSPAPATPTSPPSRSSEPGLGAITGAAVLPPSTAPSHRIWSNILGAFTKPSDKEVSIVLLLLLLMAVTIILVKKIQHGEMKLPRLAVLSRSRKQAGPVHGARPYLQLFKRQYTHGSTRYQLNKINTAHFFEKKPERKVNINEFPLPEKMNALSREKTVKTLQEVYRR